MKNPHDELRNYFKKLIYRYLNIKSLDQQLNSIAVWNSNPPHLDNIEAFNLGHYFFQHATYSIWRIFIVELSMFLSQTEQRSLRDWLKKACEHATSIKPTRYNASRATREPIPTEDYRAIIDDQIIQLHGQETVIDSIKAHRDKAIAHLDKKYFDETSSIGSDYPLHNHEIDNIMEIVDCILRKHYSCLLGASVNLEVQSVHNLDTLLKYSRAWMRARRDLSLIEKGFRPVDYERDDYKPNN